jgi:hypothetical protein
MQTQIDVLGTLAVIVVELAVITAVMLVAVVYTVHRHDTIDKRNKKLQDMATNIQSFLRPYGTHTESASGATGQDNEGEGR